MTTATTNQPKKIKDYELFLMGHPIFSAGQTGETIYVLIEGEVIICRGSEPIRTLRPGDFLNQMHLQTAEDQEFAAIARTNCHLVAVDQKIALVLEQYPGDFRVEAMRVMVERLTWRVLPPFQLAIPSHPQPNLRSPLKTRSISDTFNLATV